jgi:hypothetical protein
MAIPSLATVGGVTLVPGYAGQLAEPTPDNGTVSALNESATVVDFGQIVVRGVAVAAGQTQNCKPQTADGDLIIGVALRSAQPVASTDGNNTVNYPRYSAVQVLKEGTVFCAPCENVVAGATMLVITAAGATTSKIGSTTGGAAGAGRIAPQTGTGVWETTTLSGVIGKLRLNLA